MKYLMTLMMSGLWGCQPTTPDTQMYEVGNTSSSQAMRDGVLLRRYRLEPATSYMAIKEVFVEERQLGGQHPERLHRLDSALVRPSLLVVLKEPLKLGVLSFDWNLLLADGVGWQDRRQLTSCSTPTPLILKFDLKPRASFDSPTFSLRLQLMKDSATNVVKTVDLTAIPL